MGGETTARVETSSGYAKLDLRMDSLLKENVNELIKEALKQSPTSGNGFGFGMGTMVVVCALCIGIAFVVWKALRSDNRRNWQAENDARIEARKQFRDDIAGRFDKLEKQTKEGFDELAADAKEDGKRIAELGERILRLELKNENK